ncbi:Kelch-like protein 14 [Tupaia chinensis]|uniref:Kelch-like protein 14 n=1 Tax=Tupaia chinensis TaxID=246437 RepID=L9KNW3_TUPCH|nr:Kelch-like protein 14 [Tupaia chinensis]
MSRSGDRTSTFDPSHSDNLLHGLNLLWRKQLFCDVTLTAQGQQFHCHKAVLASCSQYFRSLFSSHPPLGGGVGGQDGLGAPKDQQQQPQQPQPPPQQQPDITKAEATTASYSGALQLPKGNVNENDFGKIGLYGFLTPLFTAITLGREKKEARKMNICDVPDSFPLRYRRAPKQIDRKCFSHLDVMLVECYDPKGDQWNILQTPILEGRSGPGCAVLDDSIYLVGGYSWSMGAYKSSTICYCPEKGTWTELEGDVAEPLAGPACATVILPACVPYNK